MIITLRSSTCPLWFEVVIDVVPFRLQSEERWLVVRDVEPQSRDGANSGMMTTPYDGLALRLDCMFPTTALEWQQAGC